MIRKIMLIALIQFCLCPGVSRADEWSKFDVAMQAAYTTVHVLDWLQTHDIENHKDEYETNPLLGRHPSSAKINAYFGGTLLAHTVIAHYLPWVCTKIGLPKEVAKYSRTLWQSVWIGVETSTVVRNYSIGISAHF